MVLGAVVLRGVMASFQAPALSLLWNLSRRLCCGASDRRLQNSPAGAAKRSADELMQGDDASGYEREGLGDMGSGSRPGRLTALSIAAVGTLSLACESY